MLIDSFFLPNLSSHPIASLLCSADNLKSPGGSLSSSSSFSSSSLISSTMMRQQLQQQQNGIEKKMIGSKATSSYLLSVSFLTVVVAVAVAVAVEESIL